MNMETTIGVMPLEPMPAVEMPTIKNVLNAVMNTIMPLIGVRNMYQNKRKSNKNGL